MPFFVIDLAQYTALKSWPVGKSINVVDKIVANDGRSLMLGAHADGVYGAGLFTEPTEDTTKNIDFIGYGILLNIRIIMLSCYDRNTFRGTIRGAKHTRCTS